MDYPHADALSENRVFHSPQKPGLANVGSTCLPSLDYFAIDDSVLFLTNFFSLSFFVFFLTASLTQPRD